MVIFQSSTLIKEGADALPTDNSLSLHVHLCAEEFIVVFIDPRTGRLTLRDTGELAAAGRGPRDAVVSDKLNESPSMIYEALIRLRYNVNYHHIFVYGRQ